MDTPASLLERLHRPGEHLAWARFVELYTPLLYYWARRIGTPAQETPDMVQDVFTLLVEKLPQFTYDRQGSFRAWLRAVALNKWRENLRHRHPGQAGAKLLNGLAGPDEAEALWDAEYRHHLVGRALELMQKDFQPATWKACWEYVVRGRPPAEVAAELGLTVGAVHSARLRVLGRLRQELTGLTE